MLTHCPHKCWKVLWICSTIGGREKEGEKLLPLAYGIRRKFPPFPQQLLNRNPRHIKLCAGLGPTTCKTAQKLQIRCFFGFFNFFAQYFFLVTLQRQLVRSEIKFMTRQLVKENHTLSSSSCQDFIKLFPAKDSKACPICKGIRGKPLKNLAH